MTCDGPGSGVTVWAAAMRCARLGLEALLLVFITRVSYGAVSPTYSQKLVAVLENDLEISAERLVLVRHPVGEADLSDRRLFGKVGIGCATVNDAVAAAGGSVFIDVDRHECGALQRLIEEEHSGADANPSARAGLER